ncbi:shikimate dehydrogenase [Savagea sp. SN6]|uniref:Shikimate dehydrogenase (NADP(+)) n=1 Tax=Savagea serpentis TaxID=2785297 RepID=A0A8J7G2X7_9BACL|nr:shikimate dehydrogenase [Savagea serpentis]MBF4500142.1 shikimate dehydrogenase [Savagea serpentis]
MKKWFAVIGDPIAQSMSPTMHEAWLQQNEVDASYIPIHVPRGTVEEAVRSLKTLGCSGWNVTVPHKEAIIPYLDEIDPLAEAMQAVNTVVVKEGRLHGYNTDGVGFVASLRETFPEVEADAEILIVGAGGAAKGISYALCRDGFRNMTIANRTYETAEQLSDQLNASAMTLSEAEQQLAQFDIIVQTTSVGMVHSQEGSPLDVSRLKRGTIVADIIYNPLQTELMKQAKALGGKTMNGIGMFVHQGAIAFQHWLDIQPDTEQMTARIRQQLGGNSC